MLVASGLGGLLDSFLSFRRKKAAIMQSLASAAFSAVRKQLFQLGVIAVLATIGLWGHKNHWGSAASHARTTPDRSTQAENPAKTTRSEDGLELGKPVRIHFPSAQSLLDLGIQSVPIERRPLVKEVKAAGVVVYEPTRLAQLSARGTGTVWRVEKQVGQAIHAGDVLAIIDSPAVGQAKADFLHSIADVQLRQKVHERLSSFNKGEVAAKLVEEAETELRKARVDLFNAQQALISLGLPVDLNHWQGLSDGELQTNVKFLGLPAGIVSQLDPNATTASLLPILAPFNGVVIGRDLAMGEAVTPTKSYFEIADVSRMWIVLDVREQDADELELGQKVVFTSGKVTLTSSLMWMSTAVDEKTRRIEVRCETENPELTNSSGQPTGSRLLRANLFGMGQIHVRENPAALTVPSKAVQWFGQSHVMFVQLDDQNVEARPVRTGIVSGQFTEIVEGVSEGEPVVVEGSHILKAELQRSAADIPPS
jgi:cobalt-zinc-cadmium efflux system membrane fusion protein